jgi:Immunoglobulin I-set domain
VVEGSAPVKVRWTLNGQPLAPLKRMNALSLGDSGSVLTVPSLDGEHSGNITCIAENFAGYDSYTAFLNVTGNIGNTHSQKQALTQQFTDRDI